MAAETEVLIKASRSFDLLTKAMREFEAYLGEAVPAGAPEYYRARNFLKDGIALKDEAVMEAKRLMGPIPLYAPKELGEVRRRIREENALVVRGVTPDEVVAQLEADEYLKGIMSQPDIDAYVRGHFESQKTGKRTLDNFKTRLILDRLDTLVTEGRRLEQDARKKRQGPTV